MNDFRKFNTVSQACLALLVLWLVGCASDAPPEPGPQIQVNTRLSGAQEAPDVALNQARQSIVVWKTYLKTGQQSGIYAQRYGPEGQPLGNVIQAHTGTHNSYGEPAVAMNESGQFAFAWYAFDSERKHWNVYARLFNAEAQPEDDAFRVNTYTKSSQERPQIAMNDDGEFVVVWSSYGQDGDGAGIFAQRYDRYGFGQGENFQVNTHTARSQDQPDLAMDSTGNFVVVWESEAQDGDGDGIFAQRYSVTGEKQGAEFQVNSYTSDDQDHPAIAMNAQGDFVVVWESDGQNEKEDIWGRRFDRDAAPQGPEFQGNTFTKSNQLTPAVAMADNGLFTVAWASFRQDAYWSHLYGQNFNAQGEALGPEFKLQDENEKVSHSAPALAMNAQGEYLTVWESDPEPRSKKRNRNRADILGRFYFKP